MKVDWNRFSFERYRWGGVRWSHDPFYIAFDLQQFAAGDHPAAQDEDWEKVRDVMQVIRDASEADPNLKPGELEPVLRRAVPASNKAERRHLIMDLAAIGILEPNKEPSFRRGWIDFAARPDPPEWKSSWFYPAGFWRGADGIDVAAVREFFPRLVDLHRAAN